MNIDELRAQLERDGWKTQSSPPYSLAKWMAYKPIVSSRVCEGNPTKPMQIEAYAYSGPHTQSVEANVGGKYGLYWFSLRAHAMSPAQFIEDQTKIVTLLLNAWESLSAHQEDTKNELDASLRGAP